MKRFWFMLIALAGLGQEVQEHLNVTLRNVRVHVLDKTGHAVTGLTREDFTIAENRKNQKITFFEEISLPPATPESNEVDPTAITVTEAAVPARPSEQRAMVIFVDSSNMTRPAFKASKDALRRFIRRGIRSTDTVKLVQYDMDLKQITPFTNSRDVLLGGVGRLHHHAAYRRKLTFMNVTIIGTITALESSGSTENNRQVEQLLYEKGQFVAAAYKEHLLGLKGMARILAQIPGERSVLLFSGTGYRDNNGDIGDVAVEKIAEDLAATLNTADITIYSAIRNEPEPIYGNSVDGTKYSDVDMGDTGQNTIDRKDRRDQISSGENKLYKHQKKNITGILKPFAEISAKQTGGIYKNINKWSDLDEALDGFDRHSRSFYKLGYLRSDPNKSGKVKIKLTKGEGRRSWRLFYGKEFVPKLAYAKLDRHSRTVIREGMLLFGLERIEDLPVQWDFLVFREPEKGYRVAVSGWVPDTSSTKGLELAFAALNRNNEPLDMTDITMSKDKGTALAPFYDVLFTRDLPHKIRFYARDLSTDAVNLHTRTVRDHIRFPILLSDLALAQPEFMSAISLNNPIPGRDNLRTIKRLERDPFHFDGIRFQPLPVGRADAAKSVGAYFHFYHDGELAKGYRVRFLFHAGGKTRLVSHEIARISRVEPGTYGFLCVLELPRLAAEDGTLELVLKTPDGKELHRSRPLATVLLN